MEIQPLAHVPLWLGEECDHLGFNGGIGEVEGGGQVVEQGSLDFVGNCEWDHGQNRETRKDRLVSC